jgi:Flp pilus assembly protein TadD
LKEAGAPDIPGAMLQLADALAKDGQYAAALPLYRRAVDLDSGQSAPVLGLGDALLKTGQNDAALTVFEKAAGDFPEDAAVLAGLGRAFMAQGRAADALNAFDAALAAKPGDARALNGRGVALEGLGRSKDAVAAFQEGLKAAPGDLALKTNLGLALALANQSDLGLPLLEEAAADPKATVVNRQGLALGYGVAGDAARARDVASIDLGPQDAARRAASYATIAALPPKERPAVLIPGLSAEKRDLAKPANRQFTEPQDAAVTVRRLLAEEPVVALAQPAPAEPQTPAAKTEAGDIPPLDDNVGYAVQIAAYRHAGELNPGWKMLKAKYGALLDGLEPRRSEVDFGDRDTNPRGFFYRLNAGPLKTYAAAKAICDAISAQGGDCWVRPPLPAEGRVADAPTAP